MDSRDYFSIVVILGFIIFSFGCRPDSSDLSDQVGVATAAESQQMMVRTLDAIESRADDENIYVGTALNRKAAKQYAELTADTDVVKRWATTYARAKVELLSGNFELSFQLYQQAEETIRDHTQTVNPKILNQFYFDTAVAFMRWGETQNCCKMNQPESCILPFRESVVHQDPAGSQQAIVWLTKVLERTKPGDDMHLAAQWLLNVAHMSLGKYPEGVPSQYLIPGVTESNTTHSFPTFRNIAKQAGVATFSLAGGAIADDFDDDGNIDLVVSSFDPHVPLRVFWNQGDRTFSPGQDKNLMALRGGLNLVQTDYNNDGQLDIFVMRGGWLGAAGKHPNSLLHNNGDRTFTDVTIRSGLETGESYPSQTAAWADFDLDGDLDLYVGNEATTDLPAPCQLFENLGDGTFRDIAKKMGVENNAMAKAVVWGDYDQDNDPDLFISNYQSPNRLYRNDGGSFTDVAGQLNLTQPIESFPSWFCDVNNDGRLDLFVAAYAGGIAELSASLLKKPFSKEALPKLFIGQPDGQFVESAERMGLAAPTHPMGANFGDLDNDGLLDFYLGTGWPELHELMPNVLYAGSPDGFVDVTTQGRVGHLQKGHAVAMADFDNDGDLDLFEQMGGFVPADKYYDVLYENPGNENRWIKLKLKGTRSNRAAIGAEIHVEVSAGDSRQSIYRTVNSGGSFGASPLEQHIGIGKATTIHSITIVWPGFPEAPQRLENVKPNSRVVVEQPK